ncbi:phage tail sheath family protein (plasmid) [Burkholderia sp. MS455]|nr:phage tail sheath family protein [Burkholderia sp. MS455]QRR11870.1 phage tail sheath family protein [Burkholderia sp. MS455]
MMVAGDSKGARASSLIYRSADSVRLYFENGGGPCYVMSLPEPTDTKHNRGAALAALPERIRACPEISLLVWCEREAKLTDDQAVYTALGTLLSEGANNAGYFLLTDGEQDTTGKVSAPQTPVAIQTAAYYPGLDAGATSAPVVYFTGLDADFWGTTTLTADAFEDVIAREEIAHPEALAIALDKVFTQTNPNSRRAAKEAAHPPRARLATHIEALTEDWPMKDLPLRASVAMAGVMARVDRERGVWKAPANVVVQGSTALANLQTGDAVRVDDAMNTKLVDAGINALRAFNGLGVMVWGARTQAPAAQTAWRYVSVRRLCNAVERDLREMLRTVVFEPNSAVTWETVRGAADHYLSGLWRQGALQGETAAQAYFVSIGLGATMRAEDIAAGRMVLKVGVSVVRPAEFIVLELTQDGMPG